METVNNFSFQFQWTYSSQ